jgi:propionyl-CoA synthetase
VFWAASDIGWVVGHSYIVYAPLLHGCTTVLYEGKPVGTPTRARSGACAPTTASTCCSRRRPRSARSSARTRAASWRGYDLVGFARCSWPASAAIPTRSPGREALSRPVIDHWWQTETAGRSPPTASGSSSSRSSRLATKPVPATTALLGEDAQEVARGATGAICVKLPLPPGAADAVGATSA